MSKKFYKILSIIIVMLIFTNSLMSAEVSSAQSGLVLNLANSVLGWFNLTIEVDVLSLIIRKSAHFLEFMILGFTVAKGWGLKFIFHAFLIVLVATLDESIQLFSEGRAFSIIDIGIDMMGGITGILFSKMIINKED